MIIPQRTYLRARCCRKGGCQRRRGCLRGGSRRRRPCCSCHGCGAHDDDDEKGGKQEDRARPRPRRPGLPSSLPEVQLLLLLLLLLPMHLD